MARRILVALGGNAIKQANEAGTTQEQFRNCATTAKVIVEVLGRVYTDDRVAITHGNGPQAGNLLLQQEECTKLVPPQDFDVVGAMTQGQIGYMLSQTIHNALLECSDWRREMAERGWVFAVTNQVLVDINDKSFQDPTKPVGNFYTENRTTDANGECVSTFTPPLATAPINITITATVTKKGYANSTGRTTVLLDLGTLDVQVTASPATIESKATSTVTVHITYNLDPVENAVVTVSSSVNGTFSVTTATTNENGYCTFVFSAPQTTIQVDITVTATATKTGYVEGQSQRRITVNPTAPTGLPLTTIIVIAAVIVVIAIVLVLVGLRIIVISWEEV